MARIRTLIQKRADPDEVAQLAVYVLDFAGTFADSDATWLKYLNSFVLDPDTWFDRAVLVVRELQELQARDSEYLQRLKAAVVRTVKEYRNQVQQTAESMGHSGTEPQESPGGQDEGSAMEREEAVGKASEAEDSAPADDESLRSGDIM